MKAAIYDPYLDTLGGGERYMLTAAEILTQHGWQTDIIWAGNPALLQQAENLFSLDLSKIRIVDDFINCRPSYIGADESAGDVKRAVSHHWPHPGLVKKISCFWQRIRRSSHYDLIIFLSDGSLPFLFAKKNILHIQAPLANNFNPLINRLKQKQLHHIIFNSQFTLKHTDYIDKKKATILYPPVDTDKFIIGQKENIILSVGRFDNILNSKRQDVLIDAFKQLYDRFHLRNWKLVLAGGSIQEAQYNNYLSHLRHISQNYPIEFFVKPKFDALKELYSTAALYWHAAGFDIDEKVHPELTEHFGITPVEAMASGCVPLVVAKGGLPEIVKDGQNGYLWQTLDDLIAKTTLLINSPSKRVKLSTQAQTDAQKFNKLVFQEKLLSLL